MEVEKYTMLYEINAKNDNNVRILGEEFVKNNKNKGIIIYKNKRHPLQESFPFEDINDNYVEIKMILNKNCYNKSFMFKDCSSLLEIKFNNCIYNKDDIIINVIDSSSNLNYSENIQTNDDLNQNSEWNTKISAINGIFSNCSSLLAIPDISNWDTSNAIDMSKMFYNCRGLLLLSDISKWDTRNVIDMSKMFYNCILLSSVPEISKWNLDNVRNIDDIFFNCLMITDNSNYDINYLKHKKDDISSNPL